MNPVQALSSFIIPALHMLPERMDTEVARIMLVAIALQESRLEHRHQIGGPAHGFWQFESGGGVKGVMQHEATKRHAQDLCLKRGVPFHRSFVFDALEFDDVLAAGFARLLLWSDPRPLPANDDPQAGWDLYVRTWRPGRPHRSTWDAFYRQAVLAVAGKGIAA